MQTQQNVNIAPLSLPKGGGSHQGMGESLGAAGPDGMASLSIPLPVSVGRGAAPSLSLSYSSSAGNGAFGLGWLVGGIAIGRRTQHGAPHYDDRDTFLSPAGEVLVIARHAAGQPDIRQRTTLMGVTLSSTHTVTRYQSRITEDNSKLEYWQPAATDSALPFWVVYSPDGQVHLLGKTAQARISDPAEPTHIAVWLPEESVTPTGEHVYYQYQAENVANCETTELEQHPAAVDAQRYLTQVSFGNITSETTPFVLGSRPIPPESWLFHTIFDYGERSSASDSVPAYAASADWAYRPDSFSRYEFGFELRIRRLCHQVLMFHRVSALAGRLVESEAPTLVSRLVLDYDRQATMSTLVAVRQLGHEPDGTVLSLPPLEFDYSRLPSPLPTQWTALPVLDGFNAQQPYQLIDLLGEGLPGILYQEQGAWWYRAPQRLAGGSPDAVTYAAATPLPATPSLQQSATLMDLTGDGQLDWVVAQPGAEGYYSQQPDGKWTGFIPFATFPVEYFHPRARLADLSGAGLPDLALIGPKSVRLYPNDRKGFTAAQEVEQADGVTLPTPNPQMLVAFSDALGTGQQHLLAITAQGVTCWPNLGHGRFGQPLVLPGFSQPAEQFNPDQVYLVDIDGSGCVDVLYAHSTHLAIYPNEGGNRFGTPYSLPLPDGVQFDDTCLLQAADIAGLGLPSLILTVPHMAPHHWQYDFAQEKPWLLNAMNNNMGADTTLRYRSSAQFWLDEKLALQAQGVQPVCHLPFPIHTLWQTESLDEITGNRLIGTVAYAQGVWDGREREFRGFGYVETCDTNERAVGNGVERAPPALTKSWFATGNTVVDSAQSTAFWPGDAQAFPVYSPRFTAWENNADVPMAPATPDEQYWLFRGLKGAPVRRELYGLDGGPTETIPYTVNEFRHQVRLCPSMAETPVVQVSEVENRTYTYERMSNDPHCVQTVLLEQDVYGTPLRSVSIAYPRRPKPSSNPYPPALPATLFASSYDAQQQLLRLLLQQNRWHHLTGNETWILGIPDCHRGDAFDYNAENAPAEGLTLETLLDESGLLADSQPRVFQGQQRTAYTDGSEPELTVPTSPVLVAYTELAMLDDTALTAFDGVVDDVTLKGYLVQGGYIQAPRLFDNADAEPVWCARQGYTDYGSASQFRRPLASRDTALTGKTVFHWDTHYCVVNQIDDAAGLSTQATYDYRFMSAVHIVDANGNESSATLDTLGRLTSLRFWGTEDGIRCGYSTPEEKPFTAPDTVDEALALSPGLPVAQSVTYAPNSWMPVVSLSTDDAFTTDDWFQLLQNHIVTDQGAVCALAYRRAVVRQSPRVPIVPFYATTSRLPPHYCVIVTDRYDNDTAQQQQQQIVFADGFGRALQASARHEPGLAHQRDESGALVESSEGIPTEVISDSRWAVTGRTEYNNKGLPVRSYQPYFLDDWRYVNDDSARDDLYADTVWYDPLGRISLVVTAKGYTRRTQAYPWFSVSEDENDTAEV
ncbi:SpvB/TcaC N-terminal domain-containing protein [Achromobacter sp.]|uniref:SpvB/TcaC N-terminal domain-containing protein n=1 Tax=Achromobacter sp. TaxID=134375 RepID=UPI003C77B6C9